MLVVFQSGGEKNPTFCYLVKVCNNTVTVPLGIIHAII